MPGETESGYPRAFGKYEVLGLIGRSGGARVYRARQASLGRVVTLTILPRQEAVKPAYRTRFERQVAAASKLRHPNILSALDAGSISGHQYIASEHVGGQRLKEVLDAGEFVILRRATEIALGVARALAHMDAVGIIHRNVTPRHVLLGEAGVPKLRGFSFSRPHRTRSSETYFELDDYAAQYRSPDVVLHKTLDIRADVYALGCVLFHMLAGRPPFEGPNAAVLLERRVSQPAPDLHALRFDLTPDLGHVVAKALERDRERRYPDAAALVADLEAVTAGRPVDPPRAARRGLLDRVRRRGR